VCDGLSVNFNPVELDEGGDYTGPHFFPGKMTYPDVRLERSITSESWSTVRDWLREVRTKWINYDGESAPYQGDPVTIMLYGSAAQQGNAIVVAVWNLANAIPISWTGPSLSAKSGEFATEKLVLRHQGLLD
jgi:phage tail-like protein